MIRELGVKGEEAACYEYLRKLLHENAMNSVGLRGNGTDLVDLRARKIADSMQRSMRSVWKYLHRLEDKGLIRRKRQGNGIGNTYTLLAVPCLAQSDQAIVLPQSRSRPICSVEPVNGTCCTIFWTGGTVAWYWGSRSNF